MIGGGDLVHPDRHAASRRMCSIDAWNNFTKGICSFMARVLLISSNFPPVTGGSAVVYENICHSADGAVIGLAASCDYATGRPFAGTEAYDRRAGYPLHRMKLLRPSQIRAGGGLGARFADLLLMTKVLARTVAVARKERADIICLGDLVYGGWLIFPLRYLFGYKVLLYVHGEEITTRDGGGLFDRWRAKFLAHAHAVIAVSSFTRDAMIRLMHTDPDKITLVPNGVDTGKFQMRDPRPEVAERYGIRGRRVVLSVGRLVPRKGTDHLVQAMPAILRSCPDAHLLIAGEGPLRPTLETLVRQLGLEPRVTLLGEVTDQALVDLYAQADIFALPNREMPDGDTEGFGLVFLEANACGKPVVSGRAGGVVDAVIDGVNGLAVDGENIDAIATAVIRLLEDEQLYHKLSEGGLEAARRGNWKSRAAQFIALCNRIAAA
jgi:glycosyltransferase involved in cell wall biosynthesis